jgi:hypothetical protein
VGFRGSSLARITRVGLVGGSQDAINAGKTHQGPLTNPLFLGLKRCFQVAEDGDGARRTEYARLIVRNMKNVNMKNVERRSRGRPYHSRRTQCSDVKHLIHPCPYESSRTATFRHVSRLRPTYEIAPSPHTLLSLCCCLASDAAPE